MIPDRDEHDPYHDRPSIETSARISGWCLIACVIIMVLAALGLTGCTTLKIDDTQRVADWPVLEPVVIETTPRVIASVCGRMGVPLQTHESCALPLFGLGLCLALVDPRTMHQRVPGDPDTRLQHETKHCLGYEHQGSRDAAQLLAAHRLWTEYLQWRAAACSGHRRTNDPDALARAFAAWADGKGCRL